MDGSFEVNPKSNYFQRQNEVLKNAAAIKTIIPKIFRGHSTGDCANIQREMEQYIKENNITSISRVCQSEQDGYITITIFY